jgi:thioredoxin-related protein
MEVTMRLSIRRLDTLLLWTVLSLILFGSMQTAAAEKTPPSADSLIGAAVKTAQAKDKVVLVHFGASWCVWCRHLDEMLQGKELGKLIAEHFVVVHLTVQERDEKKSLENPGAEELMNAQGAGKSGVPVFMFFNKDGKKIADSLALPNRVNIGYPASPEEIQAFAGILEVTTPRMTSAQRASIIDYLKKHAPAPEPDAGAH